MKIKEKRRRLLRTLSLGIRSHLIDARSMTMKGKMVRRLEEQLTPPW